MCINRIFRVGPYTVTKFWAMFEIHVTFKKNDSEVCLYRFAENQNSEATKCFEDCKLQAMILHTQEKSKHI